MYIWVLPGLDVLTHWGWWMHICIYIYYTIIGSDNGLWSVRHQAIILSYAGLLLIRPWGTYFSEIWFQNKFQENVLKKFVCKMATICVSLTVLTHCGWVTPYGITHLIKLHLDNIYEFWLVCCQAITWTSDNLLSIRRLCLAPNFSEILIKIQKFYRKCIW